MAKYKLMIDPGHEGDLRGLDPGAVSKFGKEADYTLKISLYQYKRFKELGVSVGLTRDAAEDLTETDRVNLAKQGEYCLSNHLNAGGGDRAEVIHSIHDNGRLANLIKDELLAVGQNAVKVYCRSVSNGQDYYYMHRRTGATKTNIVEYCFIDNEADFTHFKNNLEKYAEATVKAFCRHIGHPYEAPSNTASKPAEPKKPAPAAPVSSLGVHTVVDGDTLYAIGKKYGVSVATLKSLNGLKTDVIKPGQKLKVKGTASASKPAAKNRHNIPTGVIKKGSPKQKVIDVQEVMKDHDPKFDPGTVDGVYGPKTQDAVKRYQMYYGVKPYDGIYGPKTEASLKKTYK